MSKPRKPRLPDYGPLVRTGNVVQLPELRPQETRETNEASIRTQHPPTRNAVLAYQEAATAPDLNMGPYVDYDYDLPLADPKNIPARASWPNIQPGTWLLIWGVVGVALVGGALLIVLAIQIFQAIQS
jgi:hypothetical protein